MDLQIYLLILLGAETLLLVVFVYLLIHKSKQLTGLFDEFGKLRKDERQLAQKQKRQDDFLPMLVHELRSPLSVIKGSSDLILKEVSNLSSADIEKLLSQIRSSSEDMLQIVNNMLDVSKMESGVFEIDKERSDINKLLEEEREYYVSLAKEKNISISLDLERDLKEFSFDTERITQVMNNLISNALKFTPKGGAISIKSHSSDGSVRVSVADSGPGVPDEFKPKLFHKFVQFHDASAGEKGTGLGLVISKGIVEAHGGKIWVEDNEPIGAIFVFTLPLRE
jgi:signal transduction histidine kinase